GAEHEGGAAQDDADQRQAEGDVQRDADRRERPREHREQHDDHEDEPDVVRLPDGRQGAGEGHALLLPAGTTGEQIPDPPAEVGAPGEHVGDEPDAHRDPRRLDRGHGRSSAAASARAGSPSGDTWKTCAFSIATTTTPSTRYRSVKAVIGTISPGMGVTASAVFMNPRTIHGCRPTSVTTQPASRAMSPRGATSIAAPRNLR